MNAKTITIIVIVVAIVGLGGWWLTSGQSDDSNGDSAASPDASQVEQESSTINQLISRNEDLACTFSDTDEDNRTSSGTVYFSDGRMSGDFTSQFPGEDTVSSHMINDGQYQYTWEEGQTEGYKIALSAIDEQDPDDDSPQSTAVEQDEDFDFQCQSWQPDETRFTPPSDVNFTDYTAQLQQVQQQAPQSAADACKQITNPSSRAACEDAL